MDTLETTYVGGRASVSGDNQLNLQTWLDSDST